MNIRKYLDFIPQIDTEAYIDEAATVIGNVKIGKNSSIWPGAVLRGDIEGIVIGENTSVQDNCTVHVTKDLPCIVGNNVTVGHNAVIHGAVVGDNCLIGMGAVVLDGSEIGKGSIVAAGAVVGEGKKYPPYTMVAGVPAKVVKQLDAEREKILLYNADCYAEISAEYRRAAQEEK